ncbi:hypothetical protein IFM89_013703 [Coptis chinensis]|uniref:Heat shock protein 70 n=1 Tax=Coptis chinensis TaxID=261450 RepID=A0A835GW33_9MAGN|nr:hypothetical protein IFM89_013703 [Coptis chinensis]
MRSPNRFLIELLGVQLDGIPPAPRGVPQIEVKFDIDANGILSITAVDKGTGKKQDITITGASTLPNDEVQRMVSEAEKFVKEDKEKRDAIDTKNQADSVVYRQRSSSRSWATRSLRQSKRRLKLSLENLRKPSLGAQHKPSRMPCQPSTRKSCNLVSPFITNLVPQVVLLVLHLALMMGLHDLQDQLTRALMVM